MAGALTAALRDALKDAAKVGKAARTVKRQVPSLQLAPDRLTEADIRRYLGAQLQKDPGAGIVVAKPAGQEPNRIDGITAMSTEPEEVFAQLRSAFDRSNIDYSLDLRKVLERLGNPDKVYDVDSMYAPPGFGKQGYRAIYEAARNEGMGPNISSSLTPINKRRRTAALISEYLHDPLAADRLLWNPTQASKALPLGLRQFDQLSMDEQLGALLLTERDRLVEDLPDTAAAAFRLDPTRLTREKIKEALQRHQNAMRGPGKAAGKGGAGLDAWGEGSVSRALLTDHLQRAASLDAVPIDEEFLRGLGGYRRGGRVTKGCLPCA